MWEESTQHARSPTRTDPALLSSPISSLPADNISLQQQNMLRPRLRIPGIGRIAGGLSSTPAPLTVPFAQAAAQQSRSKHTVPPLNIDVENGIPGFLSPGSIEIAWTQYQTLMLEKLDQKTAGRFLQKIYSLISVGGLGRLVGR